MNARPSIIVIQQGADGEWPEWAVAAMGMELEGDDDEINATVESMLDALGLVGHQELEAG